MWCSRPQGVAIVEYTLLNSCYAPRPGTIKRNVSIHLSTIILSISIYKLKRHRYETSTVTVDSWTVEQRQSLFWCNIFASMRCNKTERDRERQTESEADLWAPITCGGVHIVHRCPHLCCSGGEERRQVCPHHKRPVHLPREGHWKHITPTQLASTAGSEDILKYKPVLLATQWPAFLRGSGMRGSGSLTM